MTGIEIVHYDPALKDELVEFRRTHYETGFPESRHYLEWKYEHNPYIREPLFYIARAGGRIVGMRAAYGTRWEVGGTRETVVLPCADDFVVDTPYRNTGLASLILREQLADLARRGYPYAINTSGGRITVMSSLASGWKSAGAMEPMVRRSGIERVRNAARNRFRKTRGMWRLVRLAGANISSSEVPFRRIDDTGRVASREAGAVIVMERAPRIDAMAGLVARLPYDGRIRHVRDAEYLTWRYRSPIREYRFFYYEREGRLEGYLALARWAECQLPTMPFHIVDWEGSDAVTREELLRCAVRVARINELGAWAAGLSQTDRDLLARYGFVPTDIEMRTRGMPCILVRSLSGAGAEHWSLGGASILDPQHWDMRLIYSMHG